MELQQHLLGATSAASASHHAEVDSTSTQQGPWCSCACGHCQERCLLAQAPGLAESIERGGWTFLAWFISTVEVFLWGQRWKTFKSASQKALTVLGLLLKLGLFLYLLLRTQSLTSQLEDIQEQLAVATGTVNNVSTLVAKAQSAALTAGSAAHAAYEVSTQVAVDVGGNVTQFANISKALRQTVLSLQSQVAQVVSIADRAANLSQAVEGKIHTTNHKLHVLGSQLGYLKNTSVILQYGVDLTARGLEQTQYVVADLNSHLQELHNGSILLDRRFQELAVNLTNSSRKVVRLKNQVSHELRRAGICSPNKFLVTKENFTVAIQCRNATVTWISAGLSMGSEPTVFGAVWSRLDIIDYHGSLILAGSSINTLTSVGRPGPFLGLRSTSVAYMTGNFTWLRVAESSTVSNAIRVVLSDMPSSQGGGVQVNGSSYFLARHSTLGFLGTYYGFASIDCTVKVTGVLLQSSSTIWGVQCHMGMYDTDATSSIVAYQCDGTESRSVGTYGTAYLCGLTTVGTSNSHCSSWAQTVDETVHGYSC